MRQRPMARARWFLGALTILALAAPVGGCQPKAEAGGELAAAGIEVGPVEEQNVEDTIVTSGRVTFDDLKVAHVYSPVNGRVTEIFAQLGTRVKKGQPLAAIQSPDIGQAVSDVHKAEADMRAAHNDFMRLKDLEKQHAASTRDV